MLKKYFCAIFALLYCLTSFSKTSAVIQAIIKNDTQKMLVISFEGNRTVLRPNGRFAITPTPSPTLNFIIYGLGKPVMVNVDTQSFYPNDYFGDIKENMYRPANSIIIQQRKQQKIVYVLRIEKGILSKKFSYLCKHLNMIDAFSCFDDFTLFKAKLTRPGQKPNKRECYSSLKNFFYKDGIFLKTMIKQNASYTLLNGTSNVLLQYPCIRKKIISFCPLVALLTKEFDIPIFLIFRNVITQNNNEIHHA